MRTLRCLVEERRGLVDDRVRITNQLTYALKQYYPQALAWFQDKHTRAFCDFLERWPTLKHVRRARKASLTAFFREHHVRYANVIEERIAAIQSAMPLTEDEAIIAPQRLRVEALVAELRVVLAAIERFDAEIERLAPALPDYALFRALPGAGPALAPRLLAAFGEQRDRYQNAAELQNYAGIAPVTERSGKKSWVHWRFASAPSSCARRSSSGRRRRSPAPSGPAPITASSATRDRPTKPHCAPWPSSGSGFSIAAGRRTRRTMSLST
jgi:hypothetical protein